MDKSDDEKCIKKNDKTGDFYVRLNYNGIRYAPMNYTKKFGCNTLEETIKKIKDFKKKLTQGENPFDTRTFDEHIRQYFKKLKPTTAYIYEKVYEKYAKPIIGNKLPNTITKSHISYIYEDMIDSKKVSSKDTLVKMRGILSPTFSKLLNDGSIEKNVLLNVELPTINQNAKTALIPLTMRLYDAHLIIIARKLYQGILKIENDDVKYYLLFTLMTARRRGEAFKTHIDDIFKDVVYANKGTTKTKIDERYILPEEILDYLLQAKKEYPFKAPPKTISGEWKKMLQAEKISYTQAFRVHDLRHLFQSVMSKKYKKELVGACISHHTGDINSIYQSFEFEDRKEVFRNYWQQVREPVVEDENP